MIPKSGKRITAALSVMLILMMAFCGCGGSDKEDNGGEGNEMAAEKYIKILSDEGSKYYMKSEYKEESSGSDEDVFEDIREISQDGLSKKYISSEAAMTKQYFLGETLYYYDGKTMTFYKMKQQGNPAEMTKNFVSEVGYKKTKEKKFGGRKMRCDICENELTEEGTTLLDRTEYYVDDKGKLAGIVSSQFNKDTMKNVTKITYKVMQFSEKIPSGTFTRPKGYTQAE